MRVSSEEMTNGCPVLISFVVKSTLISDCLAEAALHLTQLELGSPISITAAGLLVTASHPLKYLQLPEAAISLLVPGSILSGYF